MNAPTIEAVARGLSTIGRWNGRTVLDRVGQRFSVLQHTLVCAAVIGKDPLDQLYALIHDVEEVAVGDTPSVYKTVEQSQLGEKIRNEIFRAWKIPPLVRETPQWERVKKADVASRHAEAHIFLHPRERTGEFDMDVVDQVWGIIDIPPRVAIELWVDKIEELFNDQQVKRLRSLV